MSVTDALDQERLGLEDIEFLKTLRRTFESMSMGNRSRVEGTASETETDTRRTNEGGSPSGEPWEGGCAEESRSNSTWKAKYETYKVQSDELVQEINDLRQLFERTSGDQTVRIVEVLKGSPRHINNLDKALSDAVKFENALYSQKHAFNFIYLRRLKEACQTAENEIAGAEAKLPLIFNDLVPKLAKHDLPLVINKLRTFSTKTHPIYVVEEEERATTQYLALTTIATFFSSITATTLQFSYQQTSSGLSSAVNLFWFISLVFSVSSGINSLLSMVWRKSIVFSRYKSPRYINLWLTKAPIAFLAIAAFAFIVGLNLFPSSSKQQIYVSSVTNVFAVLHVLGLLTVTSWYLVKLEWSTYFIQSVRRHFLWVLHYDDKVLPVNDSIAIMTNSPADPKLHPHPFAKLLRHCVSVLIYFRWKSKEVITPINLWVRQRIFRSLFKFAKGGFRLTLTTYRGVTLAFYSLLRRLKHLHFKDSNTILRDPELSVNHKFEGSDDRVLSEGVAEVDRAVDDYISSLDKTFAVQYHQSPFRTVINLWKNGSRPTDVIARDERNLLWGYPALYRQFEEDVLPAMRAVDEQRSRPPQAPQQPQDLSRPHSEGFGPHTVATLSPTSYLRSEARGGRAGQAGVRAPSATGLASNLNGGHVAGLVSLDGNVNTLGQNSESINSAVKPISADWGEEVHFAVATWETINV